jgi:hypothetical protein
MNFPKRAYLIATGILLIGIFLRFTNLNSLPVFADESIYVRWSQVMRAESTLRFLPLSDGKQPLFMWATIPFLKIFTYDPLLAGRFLSALCGLATAMGVALAAHILFRRTTTSLIAGLLWMTIPYAVFFDRMALADSMLTCFIIWTFVLSTLSLIHKRLDLAMLAGFTLGFAWLTKSPAIFSFILIPISLILTKNQLKPSLQLIKLLALITVTYVIAFAMYNILRLGPEFHMIAIRNKDYLYPISEVLRHPTSPLIGHLKDTFGFLFYELTPIGLLFLVGSIFTEKVHLKPRLILLAWFLLPLLAECFLAITLTARYLLFTIPFAIILIAHFIVHVGDRTSKHFLVAVAALLVIIPSAVIDAQLIFAKDMAPLPRVERSGYLEEWTAGQGIKEVSKYIRSVAQTGPVVVGSEGFFGTPFSALEMYLNGVSNVRIVGVGVQVDSVSDKLSSATKDNQVFLVVNSTRFHNSDPAKIGLQLIKSFPKAIRPDGSREYLLFFKVTK